jgi:hypothetical protein
MLHRLCPTCDERNVAAAFFCRRCSAAISHVEPTLEAGPVPAHSPAVPVAAAVGHVSSDKTSCQSCGLEQAPADRCIRCDVELTPDSIWFATWPWGEETRVPTTLQIGRESSPEWLCRRFVQSGFENLSRRHAVLVVAGPSATVTDMGSSNGTYVNGVAVEPNTARALETGDELRFGTRMRVILVRRAAQ